MCGRDEYMQDVKAEEREAAMAAMLKPVSRVGTVFITSACATPAQLDEIFTYHAPTEAQRAKYEALRSSAHAFARVLIANTPAGSDQAAALRKIREAVMTANAAVALEGLL